MGRVYRFEDYKALLQFQKNSDNRPKIDRRDITTFLNSIQEDNLSVRYIKEYYFAMLTAYPDSVRV